MTEQNSSTEITFHLQQGDKKVFIYSIESIKSDQAIFELDSTGLVEGESVVLIDYLQQHFSVPGKLTNISQSELTFTCNDAACMKVRMFLQLLNIQVYKNTHSDDCKTIEAAAKVWVDDQAKAFADAIEQV